MGIITGLSIFLATFWSGVKKVSDVVIEVAGKVWDFFKSAISWIIATSPKPLKYAFFLLLILLFGGIISDVLVGVAYYCDDDELREYNSLGVGVGHYISGFIAQDLEVNQTNVCSAQGDYINVIDNQGVYFEYHKSTTIFAGTGCADYCYNESGILGDYFNCRPNEKTNTIGGCVNLTYDDGSLMFYGCPVGWFQRSTEAIADSTLVTDFSDVGLDVWQVGCSKSGESRLLLGGIDFLSYELWLLIGALLLLFWLLS